MITITEEQFRRLCDDLYNDRRQISEFNPAATPAEAVLWMLSASLYSLLSLDPEQIPVIKEPAVEGYLDLLCTLLDDRRVADFDVRRYLFDLISRVDGGDRSDLIPE